MTFVKEIAFLIIYTIYVQDIAFQVTVERESVRSFDVRQSRPIKMDRNRLNATLLSSWHRY